MFASGNLDVLQRGDSCDLPDSCRRALSSWRNFLILRFDGKADYPSKDTDESQLPSQPIFIHIAAEALCLISIICQP